ncbi:hypothetical protein LMG31841_04172 [Paraburkholderia saeva]|uniref:Uncharacterized protein n=1 Tax=Paraburkholderia saeva TaxID=2777537 RepID=A0A9N8RYH2_9BURK|nr:hypothetical protein LMG31841_04172 [Paraburkholderia saeva]
MPPHFLEVSQAQRISHVPPHAHQDYIERIVQSLHHLPDARWQRLAWRLRRLGHRGRQQFPLAKFYLDALLRQRPKYLPLTHAVEIMKCVRIRFTTDEPNEKSRAAILRIGATQDGIVRNERIMPDGRKRNSVRFSITDSEWPEVEAMFEQKLAHWPTSRMVGPRHVSLHRRQPQAQKRIRTPLSPP